MRFDRADSDEGELIEDPDCLAGLQRTTAAPQKARNRTSTSSCLAHGACSPPFAILFPAQRMKIG